MAHYLSAGLVQPPLPIICALAACRKPIPPNPSPPAFSLLRAEGAMVNPSQRDVRIFFCSEEHRDQYWKTEQGWLDRRVAMPSERALTGPLAFNRFPFGTTALESMMAMRQGVGPWMSTMTPSPGLLPISRPTTPILPPMMTSLTPQMAGSWYGPYSPRPVW